MHTEILRHIHATDLTARVVRDRDHELRVGRKRRGDVVGQRGAERRVRRRPHRLGLLAFAADLVERHRIARREHLRFFVQRLRRHAAQRAVVVEHPEAAAERAEHEVAVLLLHLHVAHLRHRHVALELRPRLAAVKAGEHAELRAREQQIAGDMILNHRPHVVLGREIRSDRRERLAAVRALQQVGRVVAALPVVERHEHDVRITRRREDVADVRPLRHAREIFNLAPSLAAVLRDLQETVVGARVDQAVEQRRFVERHDVRERGRGLVQ